MDKAIGKTVKDIMKHGEKVAPVKSIKLKVKFDKSPKDSALKKAKAKLQ